RGYLPAAAHGQHCFRRGYLRTTDLHPIISHPNLGSHRRRPVHWAGYLPSEVEPAAGFRCWRGRAVLSVAYLRSVPILPTAVSPGYHVHTITTPLTVHLSYTRLLSSILLC